MCRPKSFTWTFLFSDIQQMIHTTGEFFDNPLHFEVEKKGRKFMYRDVSLDGKNINLEIIVLL